MTYYLKVYSLTCSTWVKLAAYMAVMFEVAGILFALLHWNFGAHATYTISFYSTQSLSTAVAVLILASIGQVALALVLSVMAYPLIACILSKLKGVKLLVWVPTTQASEEAESSTVEIRINGARFVGLVLLLAAGCIVVYALTGLLGNLFGWITGEVWRYYYAPVFRIVYLPGIAFIIDSMFPKLPSLFGGIRLRGNMVLINPRIRKEPVSTTLLGSEKLRQLYDAWKSFWELGRKG
ncbi:MAG: hypothetical protein JJU20_03620 [Opitutales bacterium]|nr:hypothetical protein [Opitutales bacterium]